MNLYEEKSISLALFYLLPLFCLPHFPHFCCLLYFSMSVILLLSKLNYQGFFARLTQK